MRWLRISLVGISLSAAAAILVISLSSVTLVQSASTESFASYREWYFDSPILPDHAAYPILMAMDRARLEAANPTDRIFLELEYANRRLGYAQSLLIKGKMALAVSTWVKAEKYLLQAAGEASAEGIGSSIKQHVIDTLTFHLSQSNEFKSLLPDQDRAQVDSLVEQCQIVRDQLQSALAVNSGVSGQ